MNREVTCDFAVVPPGECRVMSQPNSATTHRGCAAEQIVEIKPGVRTESKVIYE
jgi:hypothetical protein